ncbi:hypothetical protein Gpo141_00007567 [Globisporangium polare]
MSTASILENVNPRSTVDQFDKEFRRYTSVQGGKSARAVAMARGELAKYRALLFQDKKLEEAKIKKGRLSAEDKAKYEKKIEDIEKALDKFHQDVAGYNKTKAALSFALLAAFGLLAYFQPWNRLKFSGGNDEL